MLQFLPLLSQFVPGLEVRGKVLTADQADNNTGTDDEGQDEAVHVVPWWRPALNRGAGVVIVQEGESTELRDQGVFNGHEEGRPGNSRCDDTNCVSSVANMSSVARPFQTPVDGTEEREDLSKLLAHAKLCTESQHVKQIYLSGTYNCAISNLNRLKNAHHHLRSWAGYVVAFTSGNGIVHFPGQVNSLERSREVGKDTSQSEIQSFFGNFLEAESLTDNFL